MKKWLFLFVLFSSSFLLHAEPLPADEVFQVSVKKIDPNSFSLHWRIKPGYFLYSDRIKLNSQDLTHLHLGTLRFPPTQLKTDKLGKIYTVYRKQLDVPIGILGLQPGESLLDLHYQGCSDDGFCYPPETRDIKITIDQSLNLVEVSLEEVTHLPQPEQNLPNDDISQIFSNHHWPMILLIFYGLGLLLSFTPCILPMVPVLSGIIVGHGKEVTTRKAFFLSLSYVLSMSVTYAIVGAVVALLGANIQINMQSPWIISLFSLLFVILALSMFGFYELKLPVSWQSKIAGVTRGQRGGHYLSAAIMGSLSTLILSPCVTAPLIGVLTYIAQTENVLLGSVTLFVLSLGMGTPLLLIGTSAGKWLPGAGSWMNIIKAFFGLLLLGVAILLLSRILSAYITMGLWASLLIFSGIYSGALTYSATNQEKFMQAIGIILLSYGLLILVGMSKGATNPLYPLTTFSGETRLFPQGASTKTPTVADIEQEIDQARGKPVMLDFYADWCASCKVMEATTFVDPQVQALLEQFTVIKVDVTQNNAENQAILQHFNVVAPPTFIFYNSQGEKLKSLTQVGEISAKEFLTTLQQIH
ncbi:MAG: protein-disulfide reductase DsbD [Legionella sp.]|nr:MAG: protein-disulfide reductase DsbD [Legionella sp.]